MIPTQDRWTDTVGCKTGGQTWLERLMTWGESLQKKDNYMACHCYTPWGGAWLIHCCTAGTAFGCRCCLAACTDGRRHLKYILVAYAEGIRLSAMRKESVRVFSHGTFTGNNSPRLFWYIEALLAHSTLIHVLVFFSYIPYSRLPAPWANIVRGGLEPWDCSASVHPDQPSSHEGGGGRCGRPAYRPCSNSAADCAAVGNVVCARRWPHHKLVCGWRAWSDDPGERHGGARLRPSPPSPSTAAPCPWPHRC